MTITMNTSKTIDDDDLRCDVQDELDWDPAVPATQIGVAVTEHAVTLSGTVHSLAERLAAVKAARRVKGVHALVDEIVVVPAGGHGDNDQAIALNVERILETNSSVPSGIKATVRKGQVTLTGTVDFQYQKDAANRAVRYVKGVRWVNNDIEVDSHVAQGVVRSKIVSALHRNADLEASRIHVATTDHDVWLSGTARSFAERRQAEVAAWSAPGVRAVHNNIVVG